MSTLIQPPSPRAARKLAALVTPALRGIALAATVLLPSACGAPATDSDSVEYRQSSLVLTLAAPSTYALASGAIPGSNTVTGGTGPYTCAITTNTSGGASCSATGGVVSYTAGATAGFNIKANHAGTYLLSNSGTNQCETGGVVGSTAELFQMAVSGTGYTFFAKGANKYVHTSSNALHCYGAAPDVYTLQGCTNGTSYNRYGFSTIGGSAPFWKNNSAVTVDIYNSGNGTACDPTNATAWEAFYLVPGVDVLTITDSMSNQGTVSVSVEKPLFFNPAAQSVLVNATATAQVLGGSGVFTGGSSGCTVQTNNTHSVAGCSVTGGGAVSYQVGATNAVDTLQVTDTQGHTGTLSVQASPAFSLSASTSYALAGSALGTTVTASGGSGSGTYSCTVSTNTSGGTCSVSGSTVVYTAGATAGYNIRSNRSGDYLRLVNGSGGGPYVETGGAVGSSAELFQMLASGAGYTLQVVSSGKYLRTAGTVSTGNDIVADTTTPEVYTMQNCNGTGEPTVYNRWGFESATIGAKPYWQALPTPGYIDANANGNGSACATNGTSPWEAFYLVPGVDVITITDSAYHSSTVTVSVEPPITFAKPNVAVAGSTAVTNQALGGNGIFTGGSAGCAVTSSKTGGSGTCTTTAWGTVSYTPGNTSGTDVITLTDSVGHTGYFSIAVNVNLAAISAGPNYFSCARANDNTARCWGTNTHGELGSGVTSAFQATPVTIKGLTTVSAVVTGENHACALLSNNTVQCWGDNTFGQLGNGTQVSSWSPVTVSGLTTATAISAGMLHTCALKSDGTVVCWGYNASDQIGNSGASAWPQATTPQTVTGLSSISAIAAGGFHNCALTSGGAVKCWGDDLFGQLGNGANTKSFSPVAVTGLTSGVSSIASGEQHSCAVISGTVKCWGDNTYGQLGDGTTTSRNTPVYVPTLSSVGEVAAGYVFSCARITDKTVKCWGRNQEGELGDMTTTDRLYPMPVAALNTATSISAGGLNACAMLSSGLGTCWGYNGFGQVGNNSTTNANIPTGVTFGCATCNQPDVIVASTSWSPQAVAGGSPVTFSATIFNAGTGITPVGTIVGVRWDIDGNQTNWYDQFTSGLAPGASITVSANGGGSPTASQWVTSAGPHTLQAWVDDVNRFAESDETNNKLSTQMTVGIDLMVTAINWAPSTPTAGTHVVWSAVVTNIGTVATPGGTILGVRFDIDGTAVNWEDTNTTSLAPGASVTVTSNSGPSSVNYWTATSGSHSIQAWVDDVARFNDSNTGNNKTVKTIIVP